MPQETLKTIPDFVGFDLLKNSGSKRQKALYASLSRAVRDKLLSRQTLSDEEQLFDEWENRLSAVDAAIGPLLLSAKITKDGLKIKTREEDELTLVNFVS